MNKQERSSELLSLLLQARQASQEESSELRMIEEQLTRLVSQEQSSKLLHLVRTKRPTVRDVAVLPGLVLAGLLTKTDFAVLLGSLESRQLSFDENQELIELLISGQMSEEQFLEELFEHTDLDPFNDYIEYNPDLSYKKK